MDAATRQPPQAAPQAAYTLPSAGAPLAGRRPDAHARRFVLILVLVLVALVVFALLVTYL